MNTVFYCRVGNKAQNIEHQKDSCLKAMVSDDELVKIYEDVGFSGLDTERPMMLQLVEEVSKGSFKKIITSEPHVLFREAIRIIEF